jgi:hypothetical protein
MGQAERRIYHVADVKLAHSREYERDLRDNVNGSLI